MRRAMMTLIVIVGLTHLVCMASQDVHGARGGAVINRKLLMAFQACNAGGANGCPGYKKHNVHLAQSNDGVHWLPIPGIEPFEGAVPDLIRRGNSLYVYYLPFGDTVPPGTLNVRRYNVITGELQDEDIVTVMDESGVKEAVADPSLILDENGNLVLFCIAQDVGLDDPDRCMPGRVSCKKTFRSATEVEGSNGREFIVDSGNRYERQIGSNEALGDPDVFQAPGGYVMYVRYVDESYQSGPPDATLLLFSSDLRGSYALDTALEDGVLTRRISGGSGVYDFATKQYWTYGAQVDPWSRLVIAGAVHASFDITIFESRLQTVITGGDVIGLGPDFAVSNPGLAINLP